MASLPCPHDCSQFRIVIICALELEARAVRPAFNEIYNVREHPRLGKARGDPNSYTIGRMGLYYVVLAHMPEAGKASACSVASNVTRSYSNIEMGFLVGICGAVPFRTDSNANCQNERISLGDVIIANGVIQYDLGRETDTGFFRKNTYHDTLGRPTTEIRTFLSKVRANLEYLVDPLHAHFRTKSTVQFIHESVREFMLGWFRSANGLGKNAIGLSHDHLGVLCFDYVRNLKLGNRDFNHFMHLMRQKTYSVSVNNVIKNKIPFFGYAVLNLFYHSNEAQRHDVKQSEFLRGFSAVFDGGFSSFLFYYNSAVANTKDWYNDATFLHFLCDKCLRHLVRQEVLNGSHAWQESGKRGCPMGTAVYHSDLYTIRALLGCTPDYSGSGSYRNVLENTIVVQSMKRFLEAIPQGYKVLKSNKLPQGIDIPTLLLKYAVDGANVAVLTLLWCTGLFDFNQESVYGETPLNWALEKRPAFLVYHLLNYEKDGIKVDINKPTHGNPPLKLAIQSKREREEKINILLRHGSLDRSCLDARQCNACHWAVHMNDEGLLRRLIDLGFQMNHRGVKGRSPLSHAAEFCKVRMMEILLASDPTQGDEKDADGRSPLSWVAACCFPEEKEAISDPEAKHLLQRRSLETLLRFKVDVNSEDRNQRTPLMWAVAAGNRTAVQLLSSHKDTDINCCSRFEETPLVIAIMKGDPEVVKMLLQSKRADVNLRDINGRTPLSWALGPWHPLRKDKAQISHCRNPSIARLLFESGADLNITDTFKHTPLWWAQSYDVLLARGNPEIQTYHDSPLTVLSDYLSSLEIMRALQMLTHDEAKFKCEIRLMWLVCEKFGLQAKYPWTSEIGIAILD